MPHIIEEIREDGSRMFRGPYDNYDAAKKASTELASLDFQRQQAKDAMIAELKNIADQACSLAMSNLIGRYIDDAITAIREEVEPSLKECKIQCLSMF